MATVTTDEREAVLAMMQAANEHMDQLRQAIADLQARVSALEAKG